MEALHALCVHSEEALGSTLLGHLVLQVPHTVLVGELLVGRADLWKNPALKATHVEEQVGVVFGVDRHEAVLPLDSGDRAGQTILDVPEYSTATENKEETDDTLSPRLKCLSRK